MQPDVTMSKDANISTLASKHTKFTVTDVICFISRSQLSICLKHHLIWTMHTRKHTHTHKLVFLQQLQDGGEHELWSIKTPDEIQMFPVFDVLMKDEVGHLDTQKHTVKC